MTEMNKFALANTNKSGHGAYELEMSVIGGLLLEEGPERERAFSRLTPKCFADPVLRRVYNNLRRQYSETGECDCAGAAVGLENAGIIKACMDITAIRGVLGYHVSQLFSHYRARVLERGLSEILADIGFGVPLREVIAKLRRECETQDKLDEVEDSSTSLDFMDSVVEYLNSLYAKDARPVKAGIDRLDYLLGGFKRKSVNVLAGRSGSGKSDLAVYLAVKLAAKGVRVLYLTMEMPRTQLMERIASSLTGIDSTELADREGQGTPEYARRYEAVAQALDKVAHIPLTADEEQNLSPADVEAKIRSHRPDVIFIDHMGLMRQDPKKPQWQNAFDNSQALKKIAMRENVILVELVQQNSEVEKRADKRAKLSDLKGSDGIGNDADTVMFISAQIPEDTILEGDQAVEAKLEITKNRHGKVGMALWRWQPQYHRYIPIERRRQDG